MIRLIEISKIQTWSLEKVNFYQVPYKNKSLVQAQEVLYIQHGFKLVLMRQINL
jgi:hypothetical protein